MKKHIFSALSLALVFGVMLTGCGNSAGKDSPNTTESAAENPESDAQSDNAAAVTELVVRFGDEGEPFTMHLYDNDTAAAIARHVGTSDWRLPIYHYDDYENWEVMQYYDIPSRYEIPSAPEQITEEKAGTVYYSEPNRVILFYQDAEVSAEYTPVGYFDYTDEFLKAVQDNPVLEGWGNKIVQISDGE
ncbi:cyclophilin-like fold protein [Roseburia hominis]